MEQRRCHPWLRDVELLSCPFPRWFVFFFFFGYHSSKMLSWKFGILADPKNCGWVCHPFLLLDFQAQFLCDRHREIRGHEMKIPAFPYAAAPTFPKGQSSPWKDFEGKEWINPRNAGPHVPVLMETYQESHQELGWQLWDPMGIGMSWKG